MYFDFDVSRCILISSRVDGFELFIGWSLISMQYASQSKSKQVLDLTGCLPLCLASFVRLRSSIFDISAPFNWQDRGNRRAPSTEKCGCHWLGYCELVSIEDWKGCTFAKCFQKKLSSVWIQLSRPVPHKMGQCQTSFCASQKSQWSWRRQIATIPAVDCLEPQWSQWKALPNSRNSRNSRTGSIFRAHTVLTMMSWHQHFAAPRNGWNATAPLLPQSDPQQRASRTLLV